MEVNGGFICLQARTHVGIKHLAAETKQSLGTVAAVDILTVLLHCAGPLPLRVCVLIVFNSRLHAVTFFSRLDNRQSTVVNWTLEIGP